MTLALGVATAAILAAASALFAWWYRLRPSNARDWRPEVARLATAKFFGRRVIVSNVRNFTYRSVDDFDQRWDERTYDLAKLDGLDIFFIYWGAPLIAHTIVSWSFTDGQHLAISIEARKKKTQKYSALKAFFRQFELIYVVADEADVIKLRTNYRREQVYLYRLQTSRAGARALLLDFLEAMNQLAAQPIWYNALLANCTTVIRQRVVHAGGSVAFSWRLFANAYLPELLYERGQLDRSRPFAQLKAASHINARAEALGDAEDFSAKVREGLPMPKLQTRSQAATPPGPTRNSGLA